MTGMGQTSRKEFYRVLHEHSNQELQPPPLMENVAFVYHAEVRLHLLVP
jgi:hypothetical protein